VRKSTIVSTPSDFLGKVVEELEACLEENKKDLLKLIGLSEFLCCLSVLKRERVAGRTSVSQEKADLVIDLINSLGLYCHRSVLDLLPQPDLIEGNVNHHGVYVPQGSQQGAWAILYFGLDAEFAKGAESAELNKDQKLVGRLFGYPKCCSEFFLQNNGFNQDRTPESIKDVGPFPSILNPATAELYGLSLQFHFACSPRCSQSLGVVRNRLNHLMQYAPSIAMIEKIGTGITLYGPSIGAALAPRYRQVEANSYAIEEVIVSSDKAAELFAHDGQAALLHLHSAHRFQIEDRTFDDDYHFAALFTENESSPC